MWNKEPKIMELINNHYNLELAAANMYTNFASRASKLGFKYTAQFFKKMASDKIEAHLTRIYDYLTSLEEEVKITQFSIPKENTKDSVKELVKEALEYEKYLRKHVHYVTEQILAAKDYESFEFIQWYIKDAIKDINDVNQVLSIFEAPSANCLSIENAVRKILKD